MIGPAGRACQMVVGASQAGQDPGTGTGKTETLYESYERMHVMHGEAQGHMAGGSGGQSKETKPCGSDGCVLLTYNLGTPQAVSSTLTHSDEARVLRHSLSASNLNQPLQSRRGGRPCVVHRCAAKTLSCGQRLNPHSVDNSVLFTEDASAQSPRQPCMACGSYESKRRRDSPGTPTGTVSIAALQHSSGAARGSTLTADDCVDESVQLTEEASVQSPVQPCMARGSYESKR